MRAFLHSENIRRFHELLSRDLDPEQRLTIERLLADEETQLAAESGPSGKPEEGPALPSK